MLSLNIWPFSSVVKFQTLFVWELTMETVISSPSVTTGDGHDAPALTPADETESAHGESLSHLVIE